MLTTGTLRRINERPRGINRLPLLAAGGGSAVLAALLYALLALPLPALAALLAGVLLVLVLYRAENAKTTVSLTYQGRLGKETEARFAAVSEALEGLASSSGGIHHLSNPGRRPTGGEDSLPPERGPAGVGLLDTPGIWADVPVWGVEAGEERLFFFPDAVLLLRNDRYEGISYGSLKVGFPTVRFFEGETVLEIAGSRGLSVRLEVSGREAAARFVRAFGAEDPPGDPSDDERRRSSRKREDPGASSDGQARTSPPAEVSEALGVLGLEEGASMTQIVAAYKRMARTYHPDKAAGESVEVREFAEERMKEVNAAYSALKLRGRDSAAVRGG